MLITKGNIPKRFIDRSDRGSIIREASGFFNRNHDSVSNLLYYFFALLVVSFIVILIYLSTMILNAPGYNPNSLYIVYSLFISFFVLMGYCVYLVKTLKNTLNATEFVNLCVSRTVEGFSGAYCLLNKHGKIFYYNEPFLKGYMVSNEVEKKNFKELLDGKIFSDVDILKIWDAILNNTSNTISLEKTGKATIVSLLPRPKGIFALCVIEK
jgi:hypothetical protein